MGERPPARWWRLTGMIAAFYTALGAASDVLRVGAFDRVAPAAGEVEVRIHTSGVNPSDWKARAGRGAPMLTDEIIPHHDGAGVVERAGDGEENRIGERVWIWSGQYRRARGTAAEYITLPSAQAVRLPASISFEVGACLGIPAVTALQATRLAGASPGTTILVTGAAGAVGNYAVQFCKAKCARVLATVSSLKKAASAREAGADETIDYREQSSADCVAELTGGRGVDAVIDVDAAANASSYPALLSAHGRAVIYGTSALQVPMPVLSMIRQSLALHYIVLHGLTEPDRKAVLADLAGYLESGTLRHRIARVMALHEIADAHDLVEAGTVSGKVIIAI